jgi:hypothetical protein
MVSPEQRSPNEIKRHCYRMKMVSIDVRRNFVNTAYAKDGDTGVVRPLIIKGREIEEPFGSTKIGRVQNGAGALPPLANPSYSNR